MSPLPTTARAVRFDRYGGREVLDVRDVPMPEPGPGEVLLEIPVAAAYPLDRVADAFAELEGRHTRGKILLLP